MLVLWSYSQSKGLHLVGGRRDVIGQIYNSHDDVPIFNFHHKCIHMWHLAFINYWVTYWFLLFFSSSVTTSAMIILCLCLLWRPLRRLSFSVTGQITKSLHATHLVESICYHLLFAQLCMPFSTFFTYMRTVLSSLWVTMSKWEISWILNAFIFLWCNTSM